MNFDPTGLPIETVTFPCLDHVIQLIVNDGLKHAQHFDRLLSKISRLVSHVRHSTVISDVFDGHCRLQQSNATRWNSSLNMVRSVLRVPDDVWKQIDYPGKLSAYELNMCSDYVEIMTIFEWATKMTEGNKVVTSSVVVPVIGGMEVELEALSQKYK